MGDNSRGPAITADRGRRTTRFNDCRRGPPGGYGVAIVTSAAEAVEILDTRSAEFAGLITDVNLGIGSEGWEVARHARAVRPDLPIVYMTGDSAADWAANGVPNSILVQKPYAPAQLVTAVSTLITAVQANPAP